MDFVNRFITNRKHVCWDLIKKKYPEKKTKYAITNEFVERSIKEKIKNRPIYVLDSGCGHKSESTSLPNVVLLGTDMIMSDLKKNSVLHYKFLSNIEWLPLDKKSIDVIFSNMVIEHLNDPDQYFKEVFRILKPGGYVIFSTPCIYNIVVIINRILPDGMSKKLGRILTNIDEHDIFPTVYKANSIKRIRKILGRQGFKECDLIMYQPPPYAFVFSKIFCFFIIKYFDLINRYEMFKGLRGVIIARFQKPT